MFNSLVITTLLAALTTAFPYTAPTHRIAKAIDANFPDPAIIKDGNTWYAFATTDHGKNVQVASSPDFKTWTVLDEDVMSTAGAWAASTHSNVWAPDVIRNDAGDYVLYYSAQLPNSNKHCIGAAISKRVTGPFVPFHHPLACPLAQGGAIDVSGFRDTSTNQRYIVYKVDGNSIGNGGLCGNSVAPLASTPIMLQRVATDGHTLQGAAVPILNRSDLDGPLVEAPSLTRTRDGKYVLFFSSNCFYTDLYDLSYAMADSIEGPYTKYGPLAVTGTAGLKAPGGASIAADGVHMVFHATNAQGGRSMYTTRIWTDTIAHVVYG